MTDETEAGSCSERGFDLASSGQRFGDAVCRHKRLPIARSRFREDFNEINKAKYHFPFMDRIVFPIFGRQASGSRTTEDSLPRRAMPGSWSRVPSDTKKGFKGTPEQSPQGQANFPQASDNKSTIGRQIFKLREGDVIEAIDKCADKAANIGERLFSSRRCVA